MAGGGPAHRHAFFPENRCATTARPLLHSRMGNEPHPGRQSTMASGTLGSSLTHLRDLFGGGTTVGLSDAELLRRYSGSHDGPAFEALVARHGPMVVATCRAVLRDRPRRRGRLPGHVPRPGPQGRLDPGGRRPRRLAAPRRLSGRRPGEHRGEAKAANRGGGAGDGDPRHGSVRGSDFDVCRHPARGDRPAARGPTAAGRALRPGGPDLRAGRRATALHRSRPCITGWPRDGNGCAAGWSGAA